jgi:4-coumarate--CoA ligase
MNKDQVFIFNNRPIDGHRKVNKGRKDWEEWIASSEIGNCFAWEEMDTPEKASRTIKFVYSSRNTGMLKEVEASNYNIVANARQLVHLQSLDPRNSQHASRGLCFMPMYHGLGLVYFAMVAPKRGLCVYIMERYELLQMVENIQKFRISELLMVPPIVVAMAKNPLIGSHKNDLSSVNNELCGAAPLGAEIGVQFEDLWPKDQMRLK